MGEDEDEDEDEDEYSCVTCGACCVSDYEDEGYAHVTLEDMLRFSREEEERFIHVETGAKRTLSFLYMRTTIDSRGNCRCAALEGTVGERVSCAVYDSRPNVCRKFTPGDSVCVWARRGILGISEK